MTADNAMNTAVAVSYFFTTIRILIMILVGFYFLFSLLVVRQVLMMTRVVITDIGGLLRFLVIIYAGLSLGILFLMIGILFA